MGKTGTTAIAELNKYGLDNEDREVLQWLSVGKRYSEIADIMTTSRTSVACRVHRLMNKLGTPSSAGAVGIALRQGIIK